VSLCGWWPLSHSTTIWDCGVNHYHMRVLQERRLLARLWMRLLVCRCYIQWLCNVCAACGTYVVNLMYFIISEQMVIIYILKLFNQLWCVIVKEENVFRCQFILWWRRCWCHNDMWKSKFSLMPFCKSAGHYK
jgi:hypothetical protein